MIICKDCNKQFKSNKSGHFTRHLLDVHKISLRDYTIKYNYAGISPKCICGICDDMPDFYRGKFRKYAHMHSRFDVREQIYLNRFGEPKCKNNDCQASVEFYRGLPRSYCSYTCAGTSNGGFTQEPTQQKIRDIVKERYNVDNVSYLESVKEEIGAGVSKAWADGRIVMTDEWRASISASSIKRMNEDPEGLKRFIHASSSGKFSKLHQRIREELHLDELGFKSEQIVLNRYSADELHKDKKFIIEINGDYVHANPKKYKANDIVRLYGQSFTAAEKWESDANRTKNLIDAGYAVITIWESDDLEEKRQEIIGALSD